MGQKESRALNPTQVAAELGLPIKRSYAAQTLNEDQVLDAAINMYWKRRAFAQEIKDAS